MGSLRTTLVIAGSLAACGGGGGGTDIQPTLRFADRTDVEISRILSAASGSEMFGAQGRVDEFGSTSGAVDPCPAITIAGNTATVAGGCTTKTGVEIRGTATATNPAGWDQLEWTYGQASLYELDQFAFVQAGGYTQTYDGFVNRGGDLQTWEADITTGLLDVSLRSDIYYHCSTTTCTLSGSGVELIGIGGATVSGTVAIAGQSTTSSFTLRGLDTLTATIENNCVAWQISGTDRQMVCR